MAGHELYALEKLADSTELEMDHKEQKKRTDNMCSGRNMDIYSKHQKQ